jgi:opacity protein-like surface antigen
MLRKLAALALCLASGSMLATHASAQQSVLGGFESPRWTYELRGVYFRPELEHFATFYGDDHSTFFGLAGTYRFGDRLELGGEYALMKENGVGQLSNSGGLGGSVELRLDRFQVFTNWIFQNDPLQRVVPYVGAGLLAVRYEQNIDLQPKVEGRTDLGWSGRAGVRFRIGSHGPTAGADSADSPYWRSFVFLEAQRSSAKVDDIELGGDAVVVGFRMEFDFH